MKRVLSVQDLSCLGKCSLTVALPVLSAMGCACTVLPTAVLSTHTAFPQPVHRSMTEALVPFAEHWSRVGAEFDAICVGYLSDPRQAEAVEQVLQRFPAPVVLDPAMGDHGKLYSGQTAEHVQAMARLCRRADFLLPNVTEAALLTGLPYREEADLSYLRELTAGMLEFGARAVIITGLLWDGQTTGFAGGTRDGDFRYQAPRIPRSLHGTGDLFAAVFTGATVRGAAPYDGAVLAARFVERVVTATPVSTPFGAQFEDQLPWLWEQL